jgi:predicted enzyme related to lactoylglutathione lyase
MKQGDFCWNELATNDVAAAKKFYGEILDWEFHEHDMAGMSYTLIRSKHGDKEFAGMWQIPTEEKDRIPPHWMSYILVDDVAKTTEKAKSLGAEIKIPVTPAGDFGLFSIIVDPTGAHIAFWQAVKTDKK